MTDRLICIAGLAAAGLTLAFCSRAGGQTMTYEQAIKRIPSRELPAFWVGDAARLDAILAKATAGQVSTIATSAGGRPVRLVAYGELEQRTRRANFNSAIGGRDPSCYMDKASRDKPVILLVGPVHGHEVEALTGLANLIAIMETGADLRGKAQPELRRLGERCRLLIIPEGNPDGIARFEPGSLHGMHLDDIRFWGQGTWSDDTFCGWPESKRRHPMRGDNTGFLGCYFNDAGINPMHDEFMAPMGAEAPAILRLAMAEGPDLAVSLHSHQAAPAILRPAYVPMEVQDQVSRLAGEYHDLLDTPGLPHGTPFKPQAEAGETPAPFNLTSAIYHISGAVSFTFECPHGTLDDNACHASLEQMLDIQLSLYEAMMRHALAMKE